MTLAEFEQSFAHAATTPEGAIKCLLVAAYEWFGNKNTEGEKTFFLLGLFFLMTKRKGAKMYGWCLPKDQLNPDGSAAKGEIDVFLV
jgi:hypothetical protein